MKSCWLRQLLTGIAIGLLGAAFGITSQGYRLEESYGHQLLFSLRGQLEAPDAVRIISMDRESARYLGVENVTTWSRQLHARLVDKLVDAGAALIVFNLVFDSPRGDGDDQLVRAVSSAGNVILTNAVRREYNGRLTATGSDQVMPVLPGLQQAALAVNPFIIPRNTSDIRYFWSYLPSAGGVATLPTAVFAHYLEWLQTNRLTADPQPAATGLADAILQRRFDQLLASRSISLIAPMSALMTGSEMLMLNHYGPPGTMKRLPYYLFFEAMDFSRTQWLKGKVVFVGYADDLMPEWHPGYHTPYTPSGGNSISSVELVATAFANLLERNTLRLPTPMTQGLWLFFWGFLLSCLLYIRRCRWMMLAIAGLTALYLLVASVLFGLISLAMPVVIPLVIQAPLVIAGCLLERSRVASREREAVLQQARQYLPERVVMGFVDPRLKAAADSGQLVQGVCLAMDIAQYTSFSESMPAENLSQVVDGYYDIVLDEISLAGADAWDAAGDGFMVIWRMDRPKELQTQLKVLQAVLRIRKRLEAYNRQTGRPLTVRFGIHSGEVRIGNLGKKFGRSYRAVGDVVNTTSRIESLNKELGTRILVSDELADALPGFCHRAMGSFQVRGKSRPVVLYQLIGALETAIWQDADLCRGFEASLRLYLAGSLEQAREGFTRLLEDYPEDGPSRYYLARCNMDAASGDVSGALTFPVDGYH